MESIFLSEQEQAYALEAREFFKREARPHILAMDRENEYPFELLKKMGKQGYIGVRFPARYGGGGLDMMHEALVNEETAAQSYALACARSVPHHCAFIIANYGSEEQKQKYLPGIFTADLLTAECITEPTGGSDAVRMKTKAELKGDKWVINGEKRFQASGAVADLFVVFAMTEPDVHPSKGMSVFAVEKDAPGIVAMEEFDTMGWRGLRIVSELIFDGTEIPQDNLIGQRGQGFPILMDMLNSERILVASGLLGTARTCLEIATAYTMEREAFHRPIRNFEGVSFKVAEMATRLEAANLLRFKAARMLDMGQDVTKVAAMAKGFAAENSYWVANEALQVMGGIGYTTKHDMERHFRDIRGGMVAVGTNEIMKLVVQREHYQEFAKEQESAS
ncbi:MAG: acyl-CoA dehydrogenase family protein [Desulfarculaceae bacterium]|nr:acyl-CoA dehydrogenase family protein [Desulfarculaceae bacterium]MCF8046199.1 acyl-CoA dehydrogenase family protein [Desulfarculaceae bacterium]MCF8063826.1 acyl-CoA dehydrogenase family protein [Desulfarculaceae bacterium]MCF8096357.1 acyl-CoA dehydrogenase family protein [Desulfarculaceae bacterium]MCF8121495.1 acyl-CoA dehydrogenase family protein [Desulfarculaceae bacterium]